LQSLPNFESERTGVPSLESLKGLLHTVGDPQYSFRTIHITGTNGKSTVASVATHILAVGGVSVGTFSSPDLGELTDRIMLNGYPVAMDALDEELTSLAQIVDAFGITGLTQFEALTAAAYSLFAMQGVEVGVVEVGMGGTWDATNVVEAEVSVITSVGEDHLAQIGPTLQDVALAKSGIVKPGSTLILGNIREDLVEVIERRPHVRTLRLNEQILIANKRQGVGGWMFDLSTPRGDYAQLFASLRGSHQVENVALAIAAVEELKEGSIAHQIVERSVATLALPGRFEVVAMDAKKLVVLDVAHNPDAAAHLGASLTQELPLFKGWIVVFATTHDRSPAEFIRAIGASSIDLLVSIDLGDATQVDPLGVAEIASSLGVKSELRSDLDSAIFDHLRALRDDQLLVVTGSHKLVGKVRNLLKG
jgi:dihydrofolate synthase/folylpolyglutamate synthase